MPSIAEESLQPVAANNGTWNWIKNAARTIGNYIPVICGAGVYNTGGLQLTGGAATVTVRNIQVADTQAGYQSGTFGEINFGEGLQGGLGQALYSGGGKENYLFGGVGLNLPTVTEMRDRRGWHHCLLPMRGGWPVEAWLGRDLFCSLATAPHSSVDTTVKPSCKHCLRRSGERGRNRTFNLLIKSEPLANFR